MTSEGTPNFEVVIEDIYLKVCKLQVLPSIITAHAEKLKTTNGKYPFTRTEVRLMSIPAGSLNFNYNNLFNGLRPTRVVVDFVDSQAAAGSYALNPYNFQHFNLSQIALKLNQVPVSGNVMKLNFNTPGRTILPAFTSMFEVTNKWMRDTSNGLRRDYILGGSGLYCFDVEPNFIDQGPYLNLQLDMQTDCDIVEDIDEISKDAAGDRDTQESFENLEGNSDLMQVDHDFLDEPCRKKSKVNRKRWSENEEQELRRYFSDYFDGKPGKTCPTRSECIQAVNCSEDNQGNIWKRGWETIKKKVNNMLMKNQKK